jgi:hypothetical protein
MQIALLNLINLILIINKQGKLGITERFVGSISEMSLKQQSINSRFIRDIHTYIGSPKKCDSECGDSLEQRQSGKSGRR